MGRKSLAVERRDQCLDAYEQAIVELGFVGATLEAIAERAGTHRTIIRHYFGSRDDLLDALLSRLGARLAERYRYEDRMKEPRRRIENLLGDMFVVNPDGAPAMDRVFDSLYAARDHEPRVAAFLATFYGDAERRLVRLLREAHPDAALPEIRDVASGVLGLAVGHSILDAIEPVRSRTKRLHKTARALVQGLRA